MNLSAAPAAQVTFALDTATPYLTLALSWEEEGGQRRELERATEMGRQHAERMPEAAAALFAEAGLPFAAGRVVVGTGPGSYTGVRVGASYALGLARAWGAELLGVPTLAALAGAGIAQKPQAAALDARRGNVYGAVYGPNWAELKAPAKYSAEEFAALAAELGAELRLDAAPSGLSLLSAAKVLGQPHPEAHLSYL